MPVWKILPLISSLNDLVLVDDGRNFYNCKEISQAIGQRFSHGYLETCYGNFNDFFSVFNITCYYEGTKTFTECYWIDNLQKWSQGISRKDANRSQIFNQNPLIFIMQDCVNQRKVYTIVSKGLAWQKFFFSLLKFQVSALPRNHLLVESKQWKHQNNVWNLFKINKKGTRSNTIEVVQVSLLLTLNRYHKLFWCFHCWCWTSKRRMGSKIC